MGGVKSTWNSVPEVGSLFQVAKGEGSEEKGEEEDKETDQGARRCGEGEFPDEEFEPAGGLVAFAGDAAVWLKCDELADVFYRVFVECVGWPVPAEE